MAHPRNAKIQATLPTADSSKSFWLREPNEFLQGHRTTAELPTDADVVVIGSGITGTSVAKFLLEDSRAKGMSVIILEAREACSGATGRNGGHCQASFTSREPGVSPFEIKNYETLEAYIAAHNIPCEWRSRSGCQAFFKQALFDEATVGVREAWSVNPQLRESIKLVTDPEELAELLVPTAVGAIVIERAASLWPYKLVTWMLQRLIQHHGLNLQTNTPVNQVRQLGPNSWIVETARSAIRARHVVVATNAYTSAILPEMTGLIRQVRGQMSALLPSKVVPQAAHTYCFFGITEPSLDMHDYLVQRPVTEDGENGHFMYGGGRPIAKGNGEHVGDDSTIDDGNAEYLRETLSKVLDLKPVAGEAKEQVTLTATHEWTGIMGYSKDDSPWVGGLPGKPGLWVAAGFTAHGMPCAHLSGQAIARMLLASEQGESREIYENRLVSDGDLPACYLVSRERISKLSR